MELPGVRPVVAVAEAAAIPTSATDNGESHANADGTTTKERDDDYFNGIPLLFRTRARLMVGEDPEEILQFVRDNADQDDRFWKLAQQPNSGVSQKNIKLKYAALA